MITRPRPVAALPAVLVGACVHAQFGDQPATLSIETLPDDIVKMLKAEFSYADFHIDASLDGLLAELR